MLEGRKIQEEEANTNVSYHALKIIICADGRPREGHGNKVDTTCKTLNRVGGGSCSSRRGWGDYDNERHHGYRIRVINGVMTG